jgi:hypothetical protein
MCRIDVKSIARRDRLLKVGIKEGPIAGAEGKGIKDESIAGSDIRRDRLDEASKEESVAGSFIACVHRVG